ncbi:hypothetical protein [Methanosphaerula palustris]|uniref:Uncharacterized protein n=1 Tax=Methanosphaerula palustris (strain ATCC BAA-1556 / DSM 19958 / E1-9c) TaxID=521011 RepID=B8GEK2_METPE|nr:hypothetical protein [Methanosphaerula palustris]ACL17703.1 hypothetical protein Mpal_2424 [Methanosphaerula palustris E1-9c]
MKFSVSIPDDIIALIDTRASTEGVTRTEWIRQVVTLACTPVEAGRAPENPQDSTLQNPQRTPENPDNSQQIRDLEADVRRLEELAEEKDRRIADLKGISDRLLDQGERYQVLLQQQTRISAGSPLSEPSATVRPPWWRFWK